MDCRQCSTLLYDYLDNELDEHDHSEVAKHIAHCPRCQQEWQEICSASNLYRQTVTSASLDKGFADRTLARLEGKASRLPLILPLMSLILLSASLLAVLLVILPILMPIISIIYELTITLLPVAIIILGAFPLAKITTVTLLLTIIMLATWAMRRKMLY